MNSELIQLKRTLEGEEKYYVFDPKQRQPQHLKICEQGCLVYTEAKKPFQTENAVKGTPQLSGKSERAIVVVSRSGDLYGQLEQIEGMKHHSTLLAGDDVLFAGMIQTSAEGKIKYIDYQSGHYMHGPYPLKLLIDDLGGPEKLEGVEVRLSDSRARSCVGDLNCYQPKLEARDF